MPKVGTCFAQVRETGIPDERCLELAAPHVVNDLEVLHLAWESRALRVGWTLWFVTARAVMDFLFRYERRQSREGYQDDVFAADFLAPGRWASLSDGLAKPSDYEAVREAANKLSAHLTYSRVDLRSSGGIPPSQAVHDFLMSTASLWFGHLPPERRAWFGQDPEAGPRAS